jgi:8-oxo-dGTP diphosphatase
VPRAPELSARNIHVAAGILIDADGRLLITDRSQATSMRECWEFPGGKLADGESAVDALRRELGEELGIAITSCDHFHSLEHAYPDSHVAIDFFLVRKWQGTPSGVEGQVLQWLRASEISPDLLLPADAPLLELLQELG